MKLDKLSLQFALHETGRAADVLEAYERLIYDAMSGDHTLFTTAEGIERLWELSTPLLDDPPPVRPYAPGSWGPNAIHQLIAPARLAPPVRAGLARQVACRSRPAGVAHPCRSRPLLAGLSQRCRRPSTICDSPAKERALCVRPLGSNPDAPGSPGPPPPPPGARSEIVFEARPDGTRSSRRSSRSISASVSARSVTRRRSVAAAPAAPRAASRNLHGIG